MKDVADEARNHPGRASVDYLENWKAPISAVTREFALAEDEVPVMLLPQKHRPRCLRSEWLQPLPDGSRLYGRALQGLA